MTGRSDFVHSDKLPTEKKRSSKVLLCAGVEEPVGKKREVAKLLPDRLGGRSVLACMAWASGTVRCPSSPFGMGVALPESMRIS